MFLSNRLRSFYLCYRASVGVLRGTLSGTITWVYLGSSYTVFMTFISSLFTHSRLSEQRKTHLSFETFSFPPSADACLEAHYHNLISHSISRCRAKHDACPFVPSQHLKCLRPFIAVNCKDTLQRLLLRRNLISCLLHLKDTWVHSTSIESDFEASQSGFNTINWKQLLS